MKRVQQRLVKLTADCLVVYTHNEIIHFSMALSRNRGGEKPQKITCAMSKCFVSFSTFVKRKEFGNEIIHNDRFFGLFLSNFVKFVYRCFCAN